MELNDFLISPVTGLPIRLAVDSFESYLQDSIMAYLIKRIPVVVQESKQSEVSEGWTDWFEARPQWGLAQVSSRTIIGWDSSRDLLVRFDTSASNRSDYAHHFMDRDEDGPEPKASQLLTIRAIGKRSEVSSFFEEWYQTFKQKPTSVEWLHNLEDLPLKLVLAEGPIPKKVLYPFIPEEPTVLYDRFKNSTANILLLIGPPGTGKTSFIRGYLQHTRSSATLSFDPKILERDQFFAEFLSGSTETLVLEDADNFLHSRDDGNEVMHRFLSIGNGLVSVPNKKLIFSTNLQSVHHIDSALTRPGRCFAVLNFRPMQGSEIEQAAAELNIPIPDLDKPLTLAELASGKKNQESSVSRRLGF